MYSISYTGCKPSSWPTLFTDHLLPPCNLKNKCTLLHHGDRNPSIFMPIIGAPSTLSFSMTRAMLDTEDSHCSIINSCPPEIWSQIFYRACIDTGFTGRSISATSRYSTRLPKKKKSDFVQRPCSASSRLSPSPSS